MGVEHTCHQILTCGRRLAYLKWVIQKEKPMDQSAGEREGSQKKGLESVKNQRRRPRKEPLLQYRKLIWKEGCLRKRERKTELKKGPYRNKTSKDDRPK